MVRLLCFWFFLLAIVGCGWGRQLPSREPKLTGGTAVDVSAVPYIASVEFLGRFSCPAVIIAPKWLATSAICMDLIAAEDSVVRTGATEYETGGHLWPVNRLLNHPDWSVSDNYAADLCLVQLALDIVENNTTRIIPIASQEPSPGSIARVSGWGSTAEGSIKHRSLLSVELPIYERSKCNEHYSFEVTDLRLCTLKEGAGPCDEDDGDPLVVDGTLVGIKSWIIEEQCGRGDRPSTYVNIVNPVIRDFIKNYTGV